ncbi:MAG: hypothetical protein JO089_02090 [Alphaproteobacteria bacterium]|nr:hypothetical protein [Alphaproteobacteria bacterium]
MAKENAQKEVPAASSADPALAETKKAFQEFVYIVSHDLNAPLRSVVSFSQLLKDKYNPVLDEKGLRYLDLIVDSGRKAQLLLGELIKFSRLNTVPLRMEKVDTRQLVDAWLKEAGPQISAKGAKVETGPLPQVMGDRERLYMLFDAVLGNALKFCVKPPEIAVSAQHKGGQWMLSVRDNGIGIAPQHFEAVFIMFRKLNKEEDYPGAGMGLTLAKKIVELHGGTLWLESQPNEGSTFYFTLPAAPD